MDEPPSKPWRRKLRLFTGFSPSSLHVTYGVSYGLSLAGLEVKLWYKKARRRVFNTSYPLGQAYTAR